LLPFYRVIRTDHQDWQVPVVKQKVFGGALTSLSWEKSGNHLAVGTSYSDESPATVKVFNVSDVISFSFNFNVLDIEHIFLSGRRLISLSGRDLKRRSPLFRARSMWASDTTTDVSKIKLLYLNKM
jgi:hypothetical protein